MKRIQGRMAFALWIAAVLAVAGYGWEADFEPSTYQPQVGETVTFAVCESCLDDASYRYEWDFDGDGETDRETSEPTVETTFDTEGFYEVQLTAFDGAGRWGAKRKGVLVGDYPAFAVRETINQDDGTTFVLITLTIREPIAAPGIEEGMPRGWQFELLDAGGAITNPNASKRVYEAVWGSLLEGGEELKFSYRLHPAGAGRTRLSGVFSGQLDGRFAGSICGELEVDP